MATKIGRKEQVYDYIKGNILSNKIKPGSPLREMDIANDLSMSRTPVREAFRELEAEGLIVNYPSCGTIVSQITPTDAEEIYELRVLYETWALSKCINRITNEELDALEAEFIESQQHSSEEKWHQADRALHDLIITKTGNQHFINIVKSLNVQIERIRMLGSMNVDRREHSFKEHMQIIYHLRKRDLEKCTFELKRHLMNVAEAAIEVVKLHRVQ